MRRGTQTGNVLSFSAHGYKGMLMDTYTLSFHSDEVKKYYAKEYGWTSSPVSYGVLYSKKTDNTFFGKAIRDNGVAMRACLMFASVKSGSSVSTPFSMFSNDFLLRQHTYPDIVQTETFF